MLVRSAMTARAETIGPDETLEQAARRMRELGIGALVVVTEEEPIGILTDRDIAVRSVAHGRHPSQADVRSAMTPQLVACHAGDDLEEAAARMALAAVRHLPVLDEEEHLVGMLSLDDLALREPRLAGEVLHHVLAPDRSVHTGTWDWWEEAAT